MFKNLITKLSFVVAIMICANAKAIDFNSDRTAIENIKQMWLIYFVDYNGKYSLSTFSINSVQFGVSSGYVGVGINSNEYFGNGGSDLGCFYTSKPNISIEQHYSCVDIKATYLGYYSFDLADGVISGILGFKNSNSAINYYPIFTGYIVGKAQQNPLYAPYISDYSKLQWNKRQSNKRYCLDIADDNGTLYPGLAPIKCDDNMANFSPSDYVKNVMHGSLPSGFAFRWRVWSSDIDDKGNIVGTPNYAGPGYEGRVIVP